MATAHEPAVRPLGGIQLHVGVQTWSGTTVALPTCERRITTGFVPPSGGDAMTEMQEIPVRDVTTPRAEAEDLSAAITPSVDKLAGQTVRCVRVYGNHYRCNWWAKNGDDAIGSVMGRIVRSQFLRATMTPDGLVIVDLTR